MICFCNRNIHIFCFLFVCLGKFYFSRNLSLLCIFSNLLAENYSWSLLILSVCRISSDIPYFFFCFFFSCSLLQDCIKFIVVSWKNLLLVLLILSVIRLFPFLNSPLLSLFYVILIVFVFLLLTSWGP